MAYKLSSFARKVLRKLAAGNVGRGCLDGNFQLSSTQVAASLVAELAGQDLVQVSDDGNLLISDVGRAFVRRLPEARARKPLSATMAEVGDAYRRQHQCPGVVTHIYKGRRRSFCMDLAESPLGWLAKRKDRAGRPYVSTEQIEAAERLRCDFTLAGLMPRMTVAYDGIPVSAGRDRLFSGFNPSEAQLAAKRRFLQALEAVGPELSDVLLRTCCFLDGLEDAERDLGLPARSGKIVLRIALAHLAAHYAPSRPRAKKRAPEGAQFGMGMPAG